MAPPEVLKEAQELCREYRDAIGGRRGADRPRPDREVPLLRTLGISTGHHYRLQGPVRGVHPGWRSSDLRARLLVGVQLDREAFKHSTTFGRNQWRWCGARTLATFDEENIIERARWRERPSKRPWRPWWRNYEMFHEVRGKGLMIGLQFGPPQSKALRRRFNGLEHLRTAIFSQMMVVPLFHRHRILTQVAADNVNIVKLLPPYLWAGGDRLLCGRSGRRASKDAHSGSGSCGSSAAPWQPARCDDRAKCVPGLRTYRRPRPADVARPTGTQTATGTSATCTAAPRHHRCLPSRAAVPAQHFWRNVAWRSSPVTLPTDLPAGAPITPRRLSS